jgi:hypothetical protein
VTIIELSVSANLRTFGIMYFVVLPAPVGATSNKCLKLSSRDKRLHLPFMSKPLFVLVNNLSCSVSLRNLEPLVGFIMPVIKVYKKLVPLQISNHLA